MRRYTHSPPPTSRYNSNRGRGGGGFDIDGDEVHYPTRPVDKDKAEQELTINIKKATSPEESAPKQKHVRSKSPCMALLYVALTALLVRMYCLYVGLSFVYIYMAGLASPTHLG